MSHFGHSLKTLTLAKRVMKMPSLVAVCKLTVLREQLAKPMCKNGDLQTVQHPKGAN
jgi:hypothetical protein